MPVHDWQAAERRAHERRRVALSATIEGEHEPPVGCRTVDVSLGGALVEAPTLLDDHVVVVLLLGELGERGRDGRRLIPIAADVVGQTIDAEAGIVLVRLAFRRMTRGGRARLGDVLAAVSAI